MIEIEIQSADVKNREFTRKETGEVLRFREQTGWANLGGPYPERFTINLQPDQQPHPVGRYRVQLDSFMVNRYGNLEIRRRINLEPIKSPAFGAKPASAAA